MTRNEMSSYVARAFSFYASSHDKHKFNPFESNRPNPLLPRLF